MTFALSEKRFDDPQAHDINNKAFWQKLSEIFQVTQQILKETVKEQGIDLDRLDLLQAGQEYEKIHNSAENHLCCRKTKVGG